MDGEASSSAEVGRFAEIGPISESARYWVKPPFLPSTWLRNGRSATGCEMGTNSFDCDYCAVNALNQEDAHAQ